MDKVGKLFINSPTLDDDEFTARTAKASVAFGRLRKNVWEQNGIILYTKLKVNLSNMHVRLVHYTNVMLKELTIFTYKLHDKTLENQVSRQDPRYRGSEEGGDAKRIYHFKDGLVMLQEYLMSDYQIMIFMENFRRESTLKVAKRNATKTPLKPPEGFQ